MRALGAWRWVTVVLGGACGACSLLITTADLLGPELGADGTDGGQDAPQDAPTDGVALDGADVDKGPFCSPIVPRPAFCMDFDVLPNVEDGWTFQVTNGYTTGGTSELDKSRFITSPASLRLGVPSGVPGTGSGLVNRLAWEPPAPGLGTTTTHIELEMRVNAVDLTAKAFLLSASFGESQRYDVTLLISRSSAELDEYAAAPDTGTTTPLTRLLPFDRWTHVDLDFSFVASPPTLTLKFDGEVALTKPLLTDFQTGFKQISVGPRYYTTQTVLATDVNYDNVLVDLK